MTNRSLEYSSSARRNRLLDRKGGASCLAPPPGSNTTKSTTIRISRRSFCGAILPIGAPLPKLLAAEAALCALSPVGERRNHGASNFLVDPQLSAKEQPAIWRADANPSIVITGGAGRGKSPHAAVMAAGVVLAERETHSGRHLVLTFGGRRHRLLLSRSAACTSYVIPCDAGVATRLAATAAFHSTMGSCRAPNGAEFRPSPYRRHRLRLLLALLDCFDSELGEPPTLRSFAQEVVFPGLEIGPAIEWKASSHRRQVQRLIREARRMAATGFRELLLHSSDQKS